MPVANIARHACQFTAHKLTDALLRIEHWVRTSTAENTTAYSVTSKTEGVRLGAECKDVATIGWQRSDVPTCSKGSCCGGGGAGTASSNRACGGCGPRLAAAALSRCKLPPMKAAPLPPPPSALPPLAKDLALAPPECNATGLPAEWAEPRRTPGPPLPRLGRQPLDNDWPLSGFWRGEAPSPCSCDSKGFDRKHTFPETAASGEGIVRPCMMQKSR